MEDAEHIAHNCRTYGITESEAGEVDAYMSMPLVDWPPEMREAAVSLCQQLGLSGEVFVHAAVEYVKGKRATA